MSSERDDKRPRLQSSDEIDEMFGRVNPNAERLGCPSRDVLAALAKRQRPIADPAYDHLSTCSPCYLEVRALQQDHSRQRQHRLRVWSAAAVLVLLTAAVGWFVVRNSSRDASRSGDVRAELDLRPYAATRSGSPQNNRRALALPRGRVLMTLLLPVGSEPGRYDVQILDSQLTSKASAAGEANLRNQVTTLRTTLDLRLLADGAYQLAVRRDGEDWQLFPARVQ